MGSPLLLHLLGRGEVAGLLLNYIKGVGDLGWDVTFAVYYNTNTLMYG
jgi:hypothetical protein